MGLATTTCRGTSFSFTHCKSHALFACIRKNRSKASQSGIPSMLDHSSLRLGNLNALISILFRVNEKMKSTVRLMRSKIPLVVAYLGQMQCTLFPTHITLRSREACRPIPELHKSLHEMQMPSWTINYQVRNSLRLLLLRICRAF